MRNVKNYDEFKFYLEVSDAAKVTCGNLKRVLDWELKDVTLDYQLSILDVGSSDGEMSLPFVQWLRQKFLNLHYMAIEPEKPAYRKLNERIKNLNMDYAETYNLGIEEFLRVVQNNKSRFDLILFSQCFYHIPKQEWNEIFDGSKKLLKGNGLIIVLLDSNRGNLYGLKDVIGSEKVGTSEFGELYFAEDMESFLIHAINYYELRCFEIQIPIKDEKQELFKVARLLAFLYRTFHKKILDRYKCELEEFLKKVREEQRPERSFGGAKEDYCVLKNLVKVITIREKYFGN